MAFAIQSIQFEPDALTLVYMDQPGDLRKQIVRTHQISLSREHPDYGEDYDYLQAKAVSALRNALEDFTATEPYNPADDDEDDERGMGE